MGILSDDQQQPPKSPQQHRTVTWQLDSSPDYDEYSDDDDDDGPSFSAENQQSTTDNQKTPDNSFPKLRTVNRSPQLVGLAAVLPTSPMSSVYGSYGVPTASSGFITRNSLGGMNHRSSRMNPFRVMNPFVSITSQQNNSTATSSSRNDSSFAELHGSSSNINNS